MYCQAELREILMRYSFHDLALPPLSFVVMTIYHKISRLLLKKYPALSLIARALNQMTRGDVYALRYRI
jgi:hypothetical protein